MKNLKSISKISVKTPILLWMKLRKNISLKIRHFSQKYCALMEFFKFGIKPLAVLPIIGQKTSNLSKLRHVMGQKPNRMPFLPFFTTFSLPPALIKNLLVLKMDS